MPSDDEEIFEENIWAKLGSSTGKASLRDFQEAVELLSELKDRKVEAMRLYEPQAWQLDFHKLDVPERIIRAANRAGKTLAGACEDAWAATGTHPYIKYPPNDGRMILVARDQKQIGEVFFRKLFWPGAFKIIRDHVTNEWRAYRPWEKYDSDREHLTKPAPPLVPWRLMEGGFKDAFSWDLKKERVFRQCRLVNGWTISAYPSGSDPPLGIDVDMVHMDEALWRMDWYPELAARLVDRRGRFIWTATPQALNEQLLILHEEAERQSRFKKRRIVEFFPSFWDNHHVPDDAKRTLIDKYKDDPEEYRVRILGEFAVDAQRMFPNFNIHTHGAYLKSYCEFCKGDTRATCYQCVPDDRKAWCRYMVVDPGHTVAAATFWALPPPDYHNPMVLLEDELYINNCNAMLFGSKAAEKCGDRKFQAFIIDQRGSLPTNASDGRSNLDWYEAALREAKLSSVATGCGFHLGSDDKEGRLESVRDMLRIHDDGVPYLRVLKGPPPHNIKEVVPNFIREMGSYRKISTKRDGKIIATDRPNDNGVHLVITMQYMAHYAPEYIPPPRLGRPKTPAEMRYAIYMAEKNNRRGRTIRLGPVNPQLAGSEYDYV